MAKTNTCMTEKMQVSKGRWWHQESNCMF